MHLAKITLAIVFVCVAAYSAEGASLNTLWSHFFGEDVFQWPPRFCLDNNGEEIDCPRYTVIDYNDDYQLRQYELSRWATTTMRGRDFYMVFRSMFMRLYQYITGDNIRQSRITMSVPTLTRVTPCDEGYACESEFQMSFYMSAKDGKQPPVPAWGSRVTLTTMQKKAFYVVSFEGVATQSDYEAHKNRLIGLLPEDTVITSYFYCVSYDTPYTDNQNYNEVWLEAIETEFTPIDVIV